MAQTHSVAKWGSYTHDNNEIGFASIRRTEQRGQTGARYLYKLQFVLRGVKTASTHAALQTALAALEDAYSENGRDFTFEITDGTTTVETVHKLLNSDTVNGVRVVGGVNYIDGMPGVWGMRTELVFRRTYQITLEADIYDPESGIVLFQQTIRQFGFGGRDFVVQEYLDAFPLEQTTKLFTKIRAQQLGIAVGLDTYPVFPAPIWPGSLTAYPEPLQEMQTPRLLGSVRNLHYPIRWGYNFEAGLGGLSVVPPFIQT